jgi:hypothetical protein
MITLKSVPAVRSPVSADPEPGSRSIEESTSLQQMLATGALRRLTDRGHAGGPVITAHQERARPDLPTPWASSYRFLAGAVDPLKERIAMYHTTLVELYELLGGVLGAVGKVSNTTMVANQLRRIPLIAAAATGKYLELPSEDSCKVFSQKYAAIAEQIMAGDFATGGPDYAYRRAINLLLGKLKKLDGKFMPGEPEEPIIYLSNQQGTFQVRSLGIAEPGWFGRTILRRAPQVVRFEGRGTGALQGVSTLEELCERILRHVQTSGGDISPHAEKYSDTVKKCSMEPKAILRWYQFK